MATRRSLAQAGALNEVMASVSNSNTALVQSLNGWVQSSDYREQNKAAAAQSTEQAQAETNDATDNAQLTAQAAQQYITAVMRHVEGMSWLGGAPAGPPPPLLGDPSRLRLAERIAVLAGAHAAAWGEHGHGRGDFSAGGQRPAAQ